MGHGSSKEENGAAESQSKGSRRARLKQRLHLHRRRRSRSNSPSHGKRLNAENFAGIALLTLVRAEMKFKDKWLACVSFGEQTFRTNISDQTDKPVWNSDKKLLLEKNGPHVARISIYEVCFAFSLLTFSPFSSVLKERGGQLQPVLAPAAAPRELQYVVDLPPAAAPRYPR